MKLLNTNIQKFKKPKAFTLKEISEMGELVSVGTVDQYWALI